MARKANAHISRRDFLSLTAGASVVAASGPASQLWGQRPRMALHDLHVLPAGSPLRQPYAPLHGGAFTGKQISASPDPLVAFQWDTPKSSDELQSYAITPIASFSPEPGSFKQAGTATLPILVIGEGSIRFDFGMESPAWLEFDSDDFSGAVEMSISEYNEPAVVNSGPRHRFKTASPVRYGNTYRLELNAALYEGLRFGWLHVRHWERPWHIHAVRAVCQVKPTNYVGSFACSDSMLTRIWYTGAYVVKANFCKDYFGSILMDRGDRISWTGDAHPAQSAAMVAFGNWDFVRENLKRTAEDTNGIESYPMYWVLSLVEYFRRTGDREAFTALSKQAEKLLQHGDRIFPDPPISFYGWDERLGAGFENPNIDETKNAYRMLFIRACREFANASLQAGHDELSRTYESLASDKMKDLRASGSGWTAFGLHAMADAVNTGLLTDDEMQTAYQEHFANRLDLLSYSPFNQTFIVQALVRMERYEEALLCSQDMWGGQVEYGGTTFFETYTPSWNKAVGKNGAVPNCQSGYTSLGHPWGAGVVALLSDEVLGIKPITAGFDQLEIKPRLGKTLAWVSGSVPTPHGLASLDFNRASGLYRVTVPVGTTARIGIPIGGQKALEIRYKQRILWDGTFHPAQGVSGATQAAEYIYLEGVEPGKYTFRLLADPVAPPESASALVYTMQNAQEDRATQGDWTGHYGRDGFILFNYDGLQQHLTKLPPKVSVKPSTRHLGHCIDTQIESDTGDVRAPLDGSSPKRGRKIGQLNTGDPAACQQTMSIDVSLERGVAQQVTLYCVDWEDLGRRQAIEIFDLETLGRLAPVHVLNDFTEGCYLTYRCDRSVRFRINQVRGRNAVVNALFFDPASTVSAQ